MILIHTALKCEAMPLIENLRLKKTGFNFYSNGEILLCILGVGAQKTKILAEILKSGNFSRAVNIGICGCSDENIKIGEIFAIGKKFDFLKNADLECVDKPKSEITATLCDMESAMFFKICSDFKVENYSLKIVSDYLNASKLSKNFVYNLIKAKISEIKKAIFWQI